MKSRWYFFYSIKNSFANLSWLLLIIIPLLFVLNWSLYAVMDAQKETVYTSLLKTAEKESNNLDIFVSTKFDAILDDIKIITNANETEEYLEDPNASTIEAYQLLLFRIATSRPSFIQMQMVNPNGDVIYQINRIDETTLVSSDSNLTNVSDKPYFNISKSIDPSQLYISPLHLSDQTASVTLVKPIVNDEGELLSLLTMDYDANQFMSVLGDYLSEESTYLNYGLINHESIWQFDKTNQILKLNTNVNDATIIKNRIETNEDILVYELALEEASYFTDADNTFHFFISLDVEQAINESGFILINYTVLVTILLNVISFFGIGFISYLVRKKRDSEMIIHANLYLSSQNTDSIVIVNEQLKITYVNPAFEKLFGYSLVNIHLRDIKSLIGVNEIPLHYQNDQKVDFAGHNWQRMKTGIYILSYVRIKREDFFTGQEYYIGIYSKPKLKFSDYQNYQENKQLVIKQLSRFVETYPIIIDQTCLIMIAVQNTDVTEFAYFLKQRLDDRFVIAIPHHKHVMIYVNVNPDDFSSMIYHIEELIETYRFLATTSKYFSHAFVVAKADETICNPEALVHAMLLSLIYAKDHPRQTYHIYQSYVKQQIEREKMIENELEQGFLNEEFYLNYQVQMDMKTGKYIAAEALLRWQNKNLGLISPGEFIPIIENSFYINKLSLMVIDLIIDDFKTIIDDLPKDFRIAINLCEFDFSNDYIIDQLLSKIENSPISTSHFVFEITESQYIDNVERTNRVIDLLHEKDILVAIDDFGTGYSSINLLKLVNVDFVKIDRLFIKDYPYDDDGKMFDTIVHLIRGLDKAMIVEGVETQKQLDYCKSYQCDMVQGYYIAKPLPFAEFVKQFIHKQA